MDEDGHADHSISLHLLGGFELLHDGVPLPVPRSGQRLLAFLAIRRVPTRRAYAAASLWPDTTEARAGGSLRTTLWRLRSVRPGLLQESPSHLRLGPHVVVDAQELADLALRVLDPDFILSARDLRSCAFAQDDLLADWYEDWIDRERERIRRLKLQALEAMGEHLLASRRFAEAIEAAHTAISIDPLRENSHRLLIRSHRAEGNLIEAARAFRRWRAIHKRELGCEPPDEPPWLDGLVTQPGNASIRD